MSLTTHSSSITSPPNRSPLHSPQHLSPDASPQRSRAHSITITTANGGVSAVATSTSAAASSSTNTAAASSSSATVAALSPPATSLRHLLATPMPFNNGGGVSSSSTPSSSSSIPVEEEIDPILALIAQSRTAAASKLEFQRTYGISEAEYNSRMAALQIERHRSPRTSIIDGTTSQQVSQTSSPQMSKRPSRQFTNKNELVQNTTSTPSGGNGLQENTAASSSVISAPPSPMSAQQQQQQPKEDKTSTSPSHSKQHLRVHPPSASPSSSSPAASPSNQQRVSTPNRGSSRNTTNDKLLKPTSSSDSRPSTSPKASAAASSSSSSPTAAATSTTVASATSNSKSPRGMNSAQGTLPSLTSPRAKQHLSVNSAVVSAPSGGSSSSSGSRSPRKQSFIIPPPSPSSSSTSTSTPVSKSRSTTSSNNNKQNNNNNTKSKTKGNKSLKVTIDSTAKSSSSSLSSSVGLATTAFMALSPSNKQVGGAAGDDNSDDDSTSSDSSSSSSSESDDTGAQKILTVTTSLHPVSKPRRILYSSDEDDGGGNVDSADEDFSSHGTSSNTSKLTTPRAGMTTNNGNKMTAESRRLRAEQAKYRRDQKEKQRMETLKERIQTKDEMIAGMMNSNGQQTDELPTQQQKKYKNKAWSILKTALRAPLSDHDLMVRRLHYLSTSAISLDSTYAVNASKIMTRVAAGGGGGGGLNNMNSTSIGGVNKENDFERRKRLAAEQARPENQMAAALNTAAVNAANAAAQTVAAKRRSMVGGDEESKLSMSEMIQQATSTASSASTAAKRSNRSTATNNSNNFLSPSSSTTSVTSTTSSTSTSAPIYYPPLPLPSSPNFNPLDNLKLLMRRNAAGVNGTNDTTATAAAAVTTNNVPSGSPSHSSPSTAASTPKRRNSSNSKDASKSNSSSATSSTSKLSTTPSAVKRNFMDTSTNLLLNDLLATNMTLPSLSQRQLRLGLGTTMRIDENKSSNNIGNNHSSASNLTSPTHHHLLSSSPRNAKRASINTGSNNNNTNNLTNPSSSKSRRGSVQSSPTGSTSAAEGTPQSLLAKEIIKLIWPEQMKTGTKEKEKEKEEKEKKDEIQVETIVKEDSSIKIVVDNDEEKKQESVVNHKPAIETSPPVVSEYVMQIIEDPPSAAVPETPNVDDDPEEEFPDVAPIDPSPPPIIVSSEPTTLSIAVSIASSPDPVPSQRELRTIERYGTGISEELSSLIGPAAAQRERRASFQAGAGGMNVSASSSSLMTLPPLSDKEALLIERLTQPRDRRLSTSASGSGLLSTTNTGGIYARRKSTPNIALSTPVSPVITSSAAASPKQQANSDPNTVAQSPVQPASKSLLVPPSSPMIVKQLEVPQPKVVIAPSISSLTLDEAVGGSPTKVSAVELYPPVDEIPIVSLTTNELEAVATIEDDDQERLRQYEENDNKREEVNPPINEDDLNTAHEISESQLEVKEDRRVIEAVEDKNISESDQVEEAHEGEQLNDDHRDDHADDGDDDNESQSSWKPSFKLDALGDMTAISDEEENEQQLEPHEEEEEEVREQEEEHADEEHDYQEQAEEHKEEEEEEHFPSATIDSSKEGDVEATEDEEAQESEEDEETDRKVGTVTEQVDDVISLPSEIKEVPLPVIGSVALSPPVLITNEKPKITFQPKSILRTRLRIAPTPSSTIPAVSLGQPPTAALSPIMPPPPAELEPTPILSASPPAIVPLESTATSSEPPVPTPAPAPARILKLRERGTSRGAIAAMEKIQQQQEEEEKQEEKDQEALAVDDQSEMIVPAKLLSSASPSDSTASLMSDSIASVAASDDADLKGSAIDTSNATLSSPVTSILSTNPFFYHKSSHTNTNTKRRILPTVPRERPDTQREEKLRVKEKLTKEWNETHMNSGRELEREWRREWRRESGDGRGEPEEKDSSTSSPPLHPNRVRTPSTFSHSILSSSPSAPKIAGLPVTSHSRPYEASAYRQAQLKREEDAMKRGKEKSEQPRYQQQIVTTYSPPPPPSASRPMSRLLTLPSTKQPLPINIASSSFAFYTTASEPPIVLEQEGESANYSSGSLSHRTMTRQHVVQTAATSTTNTYSIAPHHNGSHSARSSHSEYANHHSRSQLTSPNHSRRLIISSSAAPSSSSHQLRPKSTPSSSEHQQLPKLSHLASVAMMSHSNYGVSLQSTLQPLFPSYHAYQSTMVRRKIDTTKDL